MKKSVLAFSCLFACIFLISGCAPKAKKFEPPAMSIQEETITEEELAESKRSDLGLYITAIEAYEQWRKDPGKINILDCRTPEEYAFVGHAPMAYNIPSKFFTYQYDADKKEPFLSNNPDFVETVKKMYKPTDTIYVMSRSGGRSAASINALAKEGFKNVYNIIDGFEGDVINDPESYYNGKRMKNGWKNSGAPWTYQLNPKQMYLTGN